MILPVLIIVFIALLFVGMANPKPPAATPIPTGSPPLPNGEGRISFVRNSKDGKSRDLFVVNADGSNQQQVTNGIIVEGTSRWSPDGRQIVLQAGIEGISTIVRLTIGPDNKVAESVSLTADLKADSAFPAWSPDGKMLSFQSKREGPLFQVYVMDADGNNKRRLSDGKGFAGQPVWSPDAKKLLYVSGEQQVAGSNRELFVVSVDGGPPKQITQIGGSISNPQWSPDGKTITCLQIVGQQDYVLLAMNPDGSNLRTLLEGGVIQNQSFSPNGDEIAFNRILLASGSDIYTVRVSDAVTSDVTLGAGDNYMPVWSPDGKRLAWAGTPGDQPHKIVVAYVDGTGKHTVSAGDGEDYQPDWANLK